MGWHAFGGACPSESLKYQLAQIKRDAIPDRLPATHTTKHKLQQSCWLPLGYCRSAERRFQKSEFQKIVLPFTVLRRLDYALEATKDKVLETERKLREKGLENRHAQLCRAEVVPLNGARG